MKQFIQRLKIILQYNITFYILLLINIIYIIIYISNYKINSIYDIDDNNFLLTIKSVLYKEDKISFEFNEKLIGNYYFKDNDSINDYKYKIGDKLNIKGTLKVPSNNTVPNTFNYKKYLNRKGIKYILTIEDINYINSSDNIFIKIKNYVNKRIDNMKYNEYLYALVFGNSKYIDRDIYNNYKINGVLHLFSVSGLHVSLLVNIITYILNKMKFNNLLTFILTSISLILFSYLASFTPSILRATIFFILAGINKLYNFNIKNKHLLYITFIILTFKDPFYIFNLGFILSFTITYFIFLFSEKYKTKGTIKSILIISLLSFLSSLPIVINMSYEINIIGFINNIFFIPYVSYIVFPLALLNILLPFINSIFNFFVSIMEIVSSISSNIINLTLMFSKMNTIEIIIYYLLLILTIKNKKIIILLFTFIIYLYIKPNLFNKESIYIIDVGQGDSILYINNNETVLIDTGGKVSFKEEKDSFNLMKSSIIPFFKSIGVKKIDYLLITHGDADHIGDADFLVNNFKVNNVIFNCGKYNYLEKELIKILDIKNINYYTCINEINTKNKIYLLNNKDYKNENDNSVVSYLEINNYKFLFMGDASIRAEKDIIKKYNLNNIDFLKVGHHGSRTSSDKDFINKIKPKYSLISVGVNNKYGHPNKEALEALKDTKIYRTDIDGTIVINFNNKGYNISTCMP